MTPQYKQAKSYVKDLEFYRAKAIHPHWNGVLRISKFDNSITHEDHGSKGTYNYSDGTLSVFWEDYEPDIFLKISDIYLHQDIFRGIPNLEKLAAVSIGGSSVAAKSIVVSIPGIAYDVKLRLGSSDIATFDQIFVKKEYDSPQMPKYAESIIDLGANIGLATVFFAVKYPGSNILSVEPESNNFSLLLSNTADLGNRIQRQHAAVWWKDDFINLHTTQEDGSSLDAWGVQVSERLSQESKTTRCFKLGTLIEEAGFSNVDILKVDIEGAELEVFSQGAAEWLPRVNLIIIETHDRFRPGSEAAVRQAIQPMFEELPRWGENLFFRRRL